MADDVSAGKDRGTLERYAIQVGPMARYRSAHFQALAEKNEHHRGNYDAPLVSDNQADEAQASARSQVRVIVGHEGLPVRRSGELDSPAPPPEGPPLGPPETCRKTASLYIPCRAREPTSLRAYPRSVLRYARTFLVICPAGGTTRVSSTRRIEQRSSRPIRGGTR